MRHQSGLDHEVVRQRGIARVLITLHAAGVDVIRGRVVGIVLMVLKHAEQEVVLVVHHIVQAADILLSVFRSGKGEAGEAVCVGQRRYRKQFQRARRKAVLRDDVLRKRLSG